MNEEAKNEIWHTLCNAERIIRFLNSAILAEEQLTVGQAKLVKKTLDELQDAKSHFVVEE